MNIRTLMIIVVCGLLTSCSSFLGSRLGPEYFDRADILFQQAYQTFQQQDYRKAKQEFQSVIAFDKMGFHYRERGLFSRMLPTAGDGG